MPQPRQGGPPRRHPRRLRQLCLPGPVCRHPPGIRCSPPNTRCAPPWRPSTACWEWTAACPRSGGSVYDIRTLLESTVCLMDGRSPLDALPGPVQMAAKPLLRLVQGTVGRTAAAPLQHPAARHDGISHAKSPPAAVRPGGLSWYQGRSLLEPEALIIVLEGAVALHGALVGILADQIALAVVFAIHHGPRRC